MPSDARPSNPLQTYAIAAGAVLATIAFRAALQPVLGDLAPLILLMLPIFFAARQGGFGPGIFATLFAYVLGVYLFVKPPTPPHGLLYHWIAWGVPFVSVGILISHSASRLAQSRHAATSAERRAKNAERKAQRESESIRQILDSAKDVSIFTTDLSGNVTSWSVGAQRLFQYAESEALGMEAALIFTPEDRARSIHVKELETAREKGRASDDRWHLRKDGSRFFASGVVHPLKDDAGQIIGFTKIARDVTDQHETRIALDEARNRSDAALIAAEMGTFEWEVQTNRLYGDQNFARIFSTQLDETGAAPLEQYLAAIHPDDLPNTNRLIQHSLTTGQDYQAEYRIINQPQVRHILARGRMIKDPAGTVVRFPGVVIDITEQKNAELARKDSERRYQLLFDSIDQGFCLIDMIYDESGKAIDFRYIETNAAFEHQTGLRNAAGKCVKEIIANYEQHWFDTYEAIDKTGIPRRFDNYVSTLNRWFDVYAFRFGDPSLHRVAVLFTDITAARESITERERLLTREQDARSAAETANRTKDEFLATVSHELRTPLNAIVGWATLINDPNRDDETLAEGIDAIQRNAQSQAQLIDDILDTSRIISGKMRLVTTSIDLCEIIRSAIATVQVAAHAKSINITLDCLDPGQIAGDRDRLQQVFWNLLSNAIKFTDKQGHINVNFHRTNSRAFISINDNGRGIDPDFLPHIFDRFRQADMRSTRRHGGLGLGLSIVQQIIELHGGTITAHSQGTGYGATFNVELPIAPVSGEQPSTTRTYTGSTGHTTTYPAELEGKKVLILDDEPDARRVVQATLARCGIDLTLANNVPDAIGILSADHHYAAVVSDIGMPDEDGYSFVRRLRAHETKYNLPRLPAIALTAYAQSLDRTKALDAGFDAFLTKPVRSSQLIETLANLTAFTDRIRPQSS